MSKIDIKILCGIFSKDVVFFQKGLWLSNKKYLTKGHKKTTKFPEQNLHNVQ